MTNPWMIMLLGIITVFVVLFLIILFLLGSPVFRCPQTQRAWKACSASPDY